MYYNSQIFAFGDSINHDPSRFPDPFSFLPERFLTRDENGRPSGVRRDENVLWFGVGKRKCPGEN